MLDPRAQLAQYLFGDVGGVLGEEVVEKPHDEGGDEGWFLRHVRHPQEADDTTSIRCGAQEVGGVEGGKSEEYVSTLGGECRNGAQDDSGGGSTNPTNAFQFGFTFVGGGKEGDDFLEVFKIVEGHIALFAILKDEVECLGLGGVEVEGTGKEE